MTQAFDDISDDGDDDDSIEYPLGPTPEKSVVTTAVTAEKLRNMPVKSDPDREAIEKETGLNFYNDKPYGIFHSSVPTMIKWFLSVEGATITDYEEHEGAIVSVTGRLSKSFVKLQGSGRKSTAHSQMVSYGNQRE